MTTYSLRALRHKDARELLVAGAFAVWATVTLIIWFGFIRVPGHPTVRLVLAFAVPAVLGVTALLRRAETSAFPVAAGAACAVPLALFLAPVLSQQPTLAYAPPALVVGALVVHRFPVVALAAMFLICGAYGSIQAFLSFPPAQGVDLILASMWLGIAGRMLISRRPLASRLTPATLLIIGFMLLSLAALFYTAPFAAGIRAFRLSAWHLSAVLLIAYGGFRLRTLIGLTQAMTILCLLLSAYATLRWAIGPADKEQQLLTSDIQRQYNKIGVINEDKVQGAVATGSELGVWMACAIPFLIAMAISWRGVYRVIAAVAIPFALIGLLGSGQRTAAAGVVAAGLTILLLNLLSRGFRGPRLGVALAAVAAFIAAAAIVYPAVLDDPEQRKRYENILTPRDDVPVQERLVKWRQALADVQGEPFGFGLGAGHPSAVQQRFARLGADEVDSTYLKIAYEQGIFAMGFFILMLVVLLVELIRHAVWTRAPGQVALTTAAAGALVAMMVEFVGAIYIDSLAITTGWMIVGLGVAQLTSDRGDPAPAPEPA